LGITDRYAIKDVNKIYVLGDEDKKNLIQK